MKPYRLRVYWDRKGGCRWRLSHVNGRIIADSGESYTRRADLWRAVNRLPFDMSQIQIVSQ